MTLETKQRYFEEHRAESIQHHEGKFALVRNEALRGVYDTNEAAYEAGVEICGNVPILFGTTAASTSRHTCLP